MDYSAFDPIFWLHHTNADRLFAIWQAIYPDSYVGSIKAPYGTATIKPGDTINANTPLKPFHRDSGGKFWDSAAARYTTTFGYNYPETRNTDKAAVKKAVNTLYSGSAGRSLARRTDSAYAKPDGTYTEWIVNIRVAENAACKTFFVHIFLGTTRRIPPAGPPIRTWSALTQS